MLPRQHRLSTEGVLEEVKPVKGMDNMAHLTAIFQDNQGDPVPECLQQYGIWHSFKVVLHVSHQKWLNTAHTDGSQESLQSCSFVP